MATFPFSEQDILTQLKDRLSLLYSQNAALDQKAQQHITLMSAALGLAGTFKVYERSHDWLDVALLITVFLLYVFGVIIALYVLSRKNWLNPIDIQTYQSRKPFSDREYYDFIYSSYFRAANTNQGIVSLKANMITWSTRLTVIILAAVVILIAR